MNSLTFQKGVSIGNVSCILCKLYIGTQFAELNASSSYVEDDNSVSIAANREAKDTRRQQSEWKLNNLMK